MRQAASAPATTLVIFGALGDLTRRLLVPALVNLAELGLLAPETVLLGISHHESDDEGLRRALDDFQKKGFGWERVRERVHYMKGDFTEARTYKALAGKLDGNVVFYLATVPGFFGPIVDALGDAGLLDEAKGFRRIVIEKPFGSDLASAQALNRSILARVSEAQIYRIDHFLGKETVQNIMVARFGNTLFESIWNNRYIDHVQITAAEALTVGRRGKFYDATGALRDMVPNHLFQLLAMIGMEPPISFDAEAIRTEKGKVIDAILPINPAEAIRGRYSAGRIAGKAVPAYGDEPDVDPTGRTETFAAMMVHVETWRWSGVPFYLRTGKALAARDTEIVIQFKDVPLALFRETVVDRLPPNRLVVQIQPDEGINLEFVVKRPGLVVNAAPVSMDFRYEDHFEVGHQTGYENLLYDVLIGDQTLFQRADQIEGGWRAVQPLLEVWQQGTPEDYEAGSAGPESADALMHRAHRRWHKLG
jgi:glucose-6-phosphate 1-dehydrogenase